MIVALCHPYVLPQRGGCENYVATLARALADAGHEVHLFAWEWDAAALPLTIHCHRVPRPRRVWRPRRPWVFGQNCLNLLKQHRHDVSIGFDKTWGQDVLYPQGGTHTATAAHNRLVPASHIGRWLVKLRQWLDPGYWSFRHLEKKQYAGRSLVIVNSDFTRRQFALPAERIRLVPNAIDPDRVLPPLSRLCVEVEGGFGLQGNPLAPRVVFGLPKPRPLAERVDYPEDPASPAAFAMHRMRGEVVGLFAAMNYSLKGLEPLLRAVPHVPESFHLLVVGHPRYARYHRLATRLGIAQRVTFAGPVADMRRAYFAADFLVHPTFYDPCSLVVLEALAYGRPVITTPHNGAAELLDADAGQVIDDPHDAAALAKAIAAYLDEPTRQRAATAALAAARRWTLAEHLRSITAILADAAARRC